MIILIRLIDTPFTWAFVGCVIGMALGVTTLSLWLLTIGFGAYILYLKLHGPAKHSKEGWLFAAGPALMTGWMIGFIIRELIV